MSHILPLDIEEILHGNMVESSRLELKASWDEHRAGPQMLKTICAFANDLQNLNGGYLIMGIEEKSGKAVLPPKGLPPESLDSIQKWLRGQCDRLDPTYHPVFSPEIYEGKTLLVLWCPGSDHRPHSAPGSKPKSNKKYFVRIGSETVDAEKNGHLAVLMEQTARIPFDDRRNLEARSEDLREQKVREFLRNIHSSLIELTDTKLLYRRLFITRQVNGHDVPRNVGLLFFSEDPTAWFRGALIEVVQFAGGLEGDIIEEKTFKGGIHEQLSAALTYLETLSSAHFEKQPRSFRVKGWVSYPIQALREALVNAVYHRSYERCNDPVKVYLHPGRMEIISYPGPVAGLEKSHFEYRADVPPVPARNRRVGELLKELKLAEGRGTGLPKLYKAMRDNQSPDPQFDFDEARTYFRVTLPAHPEFVAISALRDAAHLKATGKPQGAFERVQQAWEQYSQSPTLTAELIRLLFERGKHSEADLVFKKFLAVSPTSLHSHVYNVFIDVLLNARQDHEAKMLLKSMPNPFSDEDNLQTAILARRAGDEKTAHRLFENVGDTIFSDTRGIHEFAQTKIKLASVQHQQSKRTIATRLLREAKNLLERVLQMEADAARHAWAWTDLAAVKSRLKFPRKEIEQSYQNALALLPRDPYIQERFANWKNTQQRGT